MLLKSEYLVKEEESVKEGCVRKECEICKQLFDVPNDEVEKVEALCDAEACVAAKESLEKQKSLESAKNDESADVIKKALG